MKKDEIVKYWLDSSDFAEEYINKIKEFRIWLLKIF